MKVLVKSTFPQSDGWGRSARDYLRSITMTSHEVRANPIVLSRQVIPPENLPNWIPDNGDGFQPDIYIQQCLPEYFEVYPQVKKHIGFAFTESRNLQRTGWIDRLNDMDSVWVATPVEKQNLIDSGVTRPIEVVRMPMEFLDEPSPLQEIKDIVNGRFSFYFIGEWVPRKNIISAVLAFWREFTREDDVVLIIKTGINGVDSPDLVGRIRADLENMKRIYRLYEHSHHYPEILVISENLSDQDIVKIHNSCDCFINLGYGESTCRPLVEAAYREKPIICTDGIGAHDPVLKINSVPSFEVPCQVNNPPLPYLYTGWETWLQADIFEAQKMMRLAYQKDSSIVINDKEEVKKNYDYNTIANIINDLL